jgi:hypothetical protein
MSARITVAVLAALLAAVTPAWPQGERQRGRAQADRQERTVEARRTQEQRRARERLRRLQESARERRAQRQGQEVTDTISRVVRIGRDGSLSLSNLAGRMAVTGGGGDEVRVEAVKRVWHRNPDRARELLAAMEVEVTEGAGRVVVRTRYPRQEAYDAEVDYTVSVPRDARVTLRTASGDITVANLGGELRAEAVSGSVTASSVGDVRLLRSVSGQVSVDGAAGDELTASTIGGTIAVRRAKARTIELRSVSGAVHVSDSEAERVSMHALSGDLEFGGQISRGGRYELESRSGRVVVAPSSTNGFEVEAATGNGEFRSDFPLTLRGATRGSRLRDVRRRRRIADAAIAERRNRHRAPLTKPKISCAVAPALLRWPT